MGTATGENMSQHEYEQSQAMERFDYSFYALIMSAMRRADNDNLTKLKLCWPDVWLELQARYNAPGGVLPGENV